MLCNVCIDPIIQRNDFYFMDIPGYFFFDNWIRLAYVSHKGDIRMFVNNILFCYSSRFIDLAIC